VNLKTVNVMDLEPHPDNPNQHSAAQVDALVDSMTTNEIEEAKAVDLTPDIANANQHTPRGEGMAKGKTKSATQSLPSLCAPLLNTSRFAY